MTISFNVFVDANGQVQIQIVSSYFVCVTIHPFRFILSNGYGWPHSFSFIDLSTGLQISWLMPVVPHQFHYVYISRGMVILCVCTICLCVCRLCVLNYCTDVRCVHKCGSDCDRRTKGIPLSTIYIKINTDRRLIYRYRRQF